MKLLSALVLGTAVSSTVLAARLPRDVTTRKFRIELAPGETRWVTEAEKWSLKKAGINFFDITKETQKDVRPHSALKTVTYPTELQHVDAVKPLLGNLSTSSLESDLTQFTSYNNRYYDADTGVQSANWLFEQANQIIDNSGAKGATLRKVTHDFKQPSIVVTIPGQSDNTVVVGAHQDSISGGASDPAPGADDNGSGSITILEALRALLKSTEVAEGKAANTIEFHWYAGEEVGLLGSQDIFAEYKIQQKNVVAMLNQDMTGYVQGTLDAGKPESFGLVGDNVDKALTEFVKLVIDGYCDIGYVDTACGYACSDHASAARNGYPSAFVFESDMNYSNPVIHSPNDTMEHVSIDHMLQHSKLVVGFLYELGFATF
ncbi:hypothetical protein VTO42DRAFT_3580 [Malbranchea cinnamomea]